jgi:hypothetical protein
VQCITKSFGNFEDKAFNISKIAVKTKQNVIRFEIIVIHFSNDTIAIECRKYIFLFQNGINLDIRYVN